MTSQQILQADVLEILFEHRNKTYGAYQLRRTYHQRLGKAVVLAISTVFLLLFFFRPSSGKNSVAVGGNEVVIHEYKLPETEIKKPEPPKSAETPRTQIKQQNFTDQIKMKNVVTDPLPPIDDMSKMAISNVTTSGAEVGAIQPPSAPEAKEAGKQNSPAEQEPKKEIVPDKQPQFPGGMQAWTAFLSRNLHAPEDLESGEKKTVIIRFRVAEDGSITNFQVEKSAGTAFDEEVIRVLKKMPKWTPAVKAGQPISVSFTQAVTFVGVEE